ncbi:aminopeptidase P N-terminal domain-containing protein [Jeongeupia chitinilytica]|uniref:Xaa-Pro aminopeptidase n=1 Tax=Jeongeupia chitinilytica TaxID=1041641 RepID=A0ABQ3H2P1_9NEIS|nr:aminopeptidase P N-terminal domain-containing protein [Jeongeupia chitinilytica]GHD67207.1 Xaa-Pro aminopeptidase [Jeongeupia chitinilytica]
MQPYAQRRAALASQLAPGLVILPTSPELNRNADTAFPYRFDSGFYYLSGFAEPESVLVLVTGDAPQSILFCREKNLEREIWDGYRYGPVAAAETFGFDAAYPIEELDERLVGLMKNQPRVYFPLGQDKAWDARLSGWLAGVRAFTRSGVAAPGEIVEVRDAINEMRLFKDAHELEIMRRTGRINVEAHKRAMRFARPGIFEYELEAELLHDYYRQGSRFPAYTSIVAGGANACVLHYIENNARIADGALVLIDAGCEIGGYASDITRTFPVNGRFSPAQKAVYEITLAAHEAAQAESRPGNSWGAVHDAATRVLAQGMLDLKLLKGSLDEVLETGSYRQFYMHRTGHWLGLDVHDAGAYMKNGTWRTLEAGMAFTIEPGFYIRPADNVPAEFENIGVRIEDNVVITGTGFEWLTDDCPRSVAEIEAWMAGR